MLNSCPGWKPWSFQTLVADIQSISKSWQLCLLRPPQTALSHPHHRCRSAPPPTPQLLLGYSVASLTKSLPSSVSCFPTASCLDSIVMVKDIFLIHTIPYSNSSKIHSYTVLKKPDLLAAAPHFLLSLSVSQCLLILSVFLFLLTVLQTQTCYSSHADSAPTSRPFTATSSDHFSFPDNCMACFNLFQISDQISLYPRGPSLFILYWNRTFYLHLLYFPHNIYHYFMS